MAFSNLRTTTQLLGNATVLQLQEGFKFNGC